MLKNLRIDSTCIGFALAALLVLNAIQFGYQLFGSRSCAGCAQMLDADHQKGMSDSSQSRIIISASRKDLSGDQGSNLVMQRSKSQPEVTSALFILYSWNYDLFWSSLQSYKAAGFGRRIIVIDNSYDRRIVNDAAVSAIVGEVIPTRSQQTFSQLQNMIADIAVEREYTYYFWGHADVAVLASNASASFSEEVLGCMDKAMESDPNWGILYFAYDWFSAIRTDLVKEVRYDTFITVYMSDCDFYPRVRAAGWETLQAEAVCPDLHVKVYDMKRPLKLPLHNYKRAKEVLEAEDQVEIDRNEWKRREWRKGEGWGWDLWGQTSLAYFRAKWNTSGETGDDCREVEITDEDTGKQRLKQAPFQNYNPQQRRRLLHHAETFY